MFLMIGLITWIYNRIHNFLDKVTIFLTQYLWVERIQLQLPWYDYCVNGNTLSGTIPVDGPIISIMNFNEFLLVLSRPGHFTEENEASIRMTSLAIHDGGSDTVTWTWRKKANYTSTFVCHIEMILPFGCFLNGVSMWNSCHLSCSHGMV